MENTLRKNQIEINKNIKEKEKFPNDINIDIYIQKTLKKLIFKSTQNIRDEILTGEINFEGKIYNNSNNNINTMGKIIKNF